MADKWIPLDELIEEFEADPQMRKLMQEARRELATNIKPLLSRPQYKRLIRGEGPELATVSERIRRSLKALMARQWRFLRSRGVRRSL